MKKGILSVLIAIMLVSFTACGSEAAPDGTSGQVQDGSNAAVVQPTEDATEFDAASWGVSYRGSAQNSSSSESFYIHFPKYTGYTAGYGNVAEQLDGTTVIVSGQNSKCPAIASVAELFPAYFDHLQFTLEGVYGILSENYQFTVTHSEAAEIGEYQMHMFCGIIQFDDDGTHCEFNYVAYATTLKSNGAYAYWVVYDTSDDQSNSALIAQHALNMAKTFQEE